MIPAVFNPWILSAMGYVTTTNPNLRLWDSVMSCFWTGREDVDAGRFSAIAVYTDMDTTFSFTSSDAMLNRIVKNTFWSVKGNFMDVPTDCPTRERAGWTGDAQLFLIQAII